jgi:hypothetical protein
VGGKQRLHKGGVTVCGTRNRGRSDIRDTHRDFEEAVLDAFSNYFHFPCDGVFRSHDDCLDASIRRSNRFQLPATREIKNRGVTRGKKIGEMDRREHDFALNRFLPGLGDLIPHVKRFSNLKVRVVTFIDVGGLCVERRFELADCS